MILFDVGALEIVSGGGVLVFFLLVFAAIVFVGYKLLKRKK